MIEKARQLPEIGSALPETPEVAIALVALKCRAGENLKIPKAV